MSMNDIDSAKHTSGQPTGVLPNQIGTPRQFVWLRRIVLAVIVLNAIDAVLTLMWVWRGRAIEANPIMADLVHNNPLLFVLVKMVLAGLGTFFLWRLRRRKFAVISIFGIFLVYYYLLLYHLNAMNIGLIRRLFQ